MLNSNRSFESHLNSFENQSSKFTTNVQPAEIFLSTLCLYGLITNIMNVIVFSQKDKLKNKIYRYFLWHSIVDIFYLAICFIRFIIKSDGLHSIHHSYWTQVFDAYAYKYLTSSLAILMILVELIIAIKRLFIITNAHVTFKLSLRTVFWAVTIVAFCSYLPFGMMLRVVDENNCNITIELYECQNASTSISKYVITMAYSPRSSFHKNFYSCITIFRGILAPVLLLVINIIIIIKFRKVFKRKRWLTDGIIRSSKTSWNKAFTFNIACLCFLDQIGNNPAESFERLSAQNTVRNIEPDLRAAKKNLAKLVIVYNFVFFLSNSVVTIGYASLYVLGYSRTTTRTMFLISNSILFLAHGSGFFIYFSFDKLFRKIFITKCSCFFSFQTP